MYDQKRQRLVEDFRFFYYYDNNGNLSGKVSKTSSEVTNFIHNTQNQLDGIESFDGQTKTKEVCYVYDALGRRGQKQITDLVNAANSHTRKFGYDGQDLIFEFNESNELLATYTHSGLRKDDILAADFTSKAIEAKRSKNDGSYFYLKDALGSGIIFNHINSIIMDATRAPISLLPAEETTLEHLGPVDIPQPQ